MDGMFRPLSETFDAIGMHLSSIPLIPRTVFNRNRGRWMKMFFTR